MRTKDEILEDRRQNIAHTTTPGNFSNYQGELLLEVLIDIRDILAADMETSMAISKAIGKRKGGS